MISVAELALVYQYKNDANKILKMLIIILIFLKWFIEAGQNIVADGLSTWLIGGMLEMPEVSGSHVRADC